MVDVKIPPKTGLILAGLGALLAFLFFTLDRSLKDVSSDRNDHSEQWMEIYYKGKKVGYAISHTRTSGKGFVIEEETFLSLTLMSEPTDTRIWSKSFIEPDFFLDKFEFSIVSRNVPFRAAGAVCGKRLLVQTGEGKEARRLEVELSGRPIDGAGVMQFFKGRALQTGQTFNFSFFDPSIMSQEEMVVKVIGEDPIRLNGVSCPAVKLRTEMLGQEATLWLDPSGSLLKEEGFMGFVFVRSDAFHAPKGVETGGGDLFEEASIPVDQDLDEPQGLSYLKLRIEGLGEAEKDLIALNGSRQRFAGGCVEIFRERPPARGASFDDGARGRETGFLGPEPGIESDDPAVVAKAREIAGGADDPVSVARMLMHWVYDNIEKKPVLSVPSARAALESRVGDCNEHAVLLAALLRASSIPSRVCCGLVYERGRFFYHAWTEAYLGAWVSLDAALNQMPADATHVKFVQGGVSSQTSIVRLMGKLKLKILDQRQG